MLQAIHTDAAPAAVGPYSQAIRHEDMLYLSGQIGLLPGEGRLVDDSLAGQAKQVMRNLSAVLKGGGSKLEDIVKVTIYLTDMGDFPELNGLYAEWLGEHRPARATVAVAALPLGARVEMDVIARYEG